MLLSKSSIYLGNDKIKSIYLGNQLIYRDSNKRELTLIKFDDAIYNGIYVAPKYSVIYEDSLNLIKFDDAIYNGVYVAPKYSIIYEDSLTLIKFSEV